MIGDERRSLPPSYFDAMYEADDDPWGFETREYEAAKYEATLDALPNQPYERVFEIGCSVGVLTARLAERCDELLAVDVSERALEQARARCQGMPHVRFQLMQVPREFPEERFDLILLSEVGYYWGWPDLRRAQRLIIDHLDPGGHLVLVHWTPFVEDYPLTGDQVHDSFLADTRPELRHLHGHRADLYRLDVFQRVPSGPEASP